MSQEISIFLKHKRFQARLKIIFLYKMAEAMFEVVLPDYFKKISTKFQICYYCKNP